MNIELKVWQRVSQCKPSVPPAIFPTTHLKNTSRWGAIFQRPTKSRLPAFPNWKTRKGSFGIGQWSAVDLWVFRSQWSICAHHDWHPHDQRHQHPSEESKLRGPQSPCGEAGGAMLSLESLKNFYFIPDLLSPQSVPLGLLCYWFPPPTNVGG